MTVPRGPVLFSTPGSPLFAMGYRFANPPVYNDIVGCEHHGAWRISLRLNYPSATRRPRYENYQLVKSNTFYWCSWGGGVCPYFPTWHKVNGPAMKYCNAFIYLYVAHSISLRYSFNHDNTAVHCFSRIIFLFNISTTASLSSLFMHFLVTKIAVFIDKQFGNKFNRKILAICVLTWMYSR